MNKKSQSLKHFQNKQFLTSKNTQLGELLNQIDNPDPESIEAVNIQQSAPTQQPQDSLTQLLARAQKITTKKSKKLKAKIGKIEEDDAFLTGVNVQVEQEPIKQENEVSLFDQQIIKLLGRKTLDDDLQQLRREIKATNGTLRGYEQQVLKSKKSITRLAGRYNSYFNLQIPVNKPTVDFSGYSVGMKSFKQMFLPKE